MIRQQPPYARTEGASAKMDERLFKKSPTSPLIRDVIINYIFHMKGQSKKDSAIYVRPISLSVKNSGNVDKPKNNSLAISKFINTSQLIAEAVTHMHPDKLCDQISDMLLDEYMKQDPFSRVAIETVGGHGHISLFGEVTSRGRVNMKRAVKDFYTLSTEKDIAVTCNISEQSPEISQKVNNGGAGDQGIMIGYACAENELHIPQEMYLARKLLEGFYIDGKSQVVIENGQVTSVVLSVQGKTENDLKRKIKKCGINIDEKKIFANNIGSFDVGSFDADSGCTGRKIVNDAYGPRVPVGGGAFSGKDPTKVDRSAAYMARWLALKLLKEKGAQEVLVKIGYVIGKAEPLIQVAYVDGTEENIKHDCRPQAIIERFDLLRPIFLDTAKYGHFGRGRSVPWENNIS